MDVYDSQQDEPKQAPLKISVACKFLITVQKDPSTIVMPFHETELFSTHSRLSENRKCKSSSLTKTPFLPLRRSSALFYLK